MDEVKIIKRGKRVTSLYLPADEFFIVNDNDPDLDPIKIYLPEPPNLRTIDGYGLKPEDQMWEVPRMPLELQKIIDESYTSEQIIETLEADRLKYQDEIDWIKLQWERRENGYWLFINGKPTYLDGWHYFYCGFWHLDVGLAEYRDRDRRFFLFARDCYTTTKDWTGKNYFFRTVLGFAYPKHRRDGATHKVLCIGYEIISKSFNYYGGIQSFDDNNAENHFQEKLIPAWQNMPFFFRPIFDGSTNPKEKLVLKEPAKRSKQGETIISKKVVLGGNFTFATTSHRKFYDGKKLHFIDLEEEGKTLRENVLERWDVIRECLGQGAGAKLHGFAIHPTTVADMEFQGGENYHELCEMSKYKDVDEISGMSRSGLRRLFIPAYDGLEGFVGPYGESIIDTPTKKQSLFIHKSVGAKKHLQSRKDLLLKNGDIESMRRYYTQVELYPISYADCFRINDGGSGFDIAILDESIRRLGINKDNPAKSTLRGDFKWVVDGEILSAAEFLRKNYHLKNVEGRIEFFDDINGRFDISKKLDSNLSNKKIVVNGIYQPLNPKDYTASADPFKFRKKDEVKVSGNKSKMSNGGGSVFWERDKTIDPEDKDIKDWESGRFVCTYNNLTNDEDEYAEEMLMMSIYYGAMMFPEINVRLVWKHFDKRGYGGFLKYDIDTITGKLKDKPGFTSLEGSKQKLFNAVRNYIKHHGHRERHIGFLKECKEIPGIWQMTKYDLFTACGGALLGSQSDYGELIIRNKDIAELDDYLEVYEF